MKCLLFCLKSGWEIFYFSYVDVYNSEYLRELYECFGFFFLNNQKGCLMTFCFLSSEFGASLHWVTMILLIKIGYSYCVISLTKTEFVCLSVLEKASPIYTVFLSIIVKRGSNMFIM